MADTEQGIIEELVRAEMAKIAAENAAKNPQLQVTDAPITLKILGTDYSYKDKAEMETALSGTFKRALDEIETAKAAASQTQNNPGQQVTGKEETDTFSQDKYIELMGKGPKGIVEATKYALNYALFDGKEADPALAIRATMAEASRNAASVAVYQFRELHPEFPMTADATKIIDGIRNELHQPFSIQGLEAAYGVAQSRGLLPSPQVMAYHQRLVQEGKLIEMPNQQQQQQNNQVFDPRTANFSPYQQQQPLGFQPPPGVTRTATAPPSNLAAQAENMSLEELTRVLRAAGQPV